ncbi:hypothetical protein LDENG_00299490 [Lucifuga dentata]|nr:hypothetical protein LDENG_00299490 [Lucifuga dentata]
MDLDIRHYLSKAKEQQDTGALQSAYRLIKETTATGSSRQTPRFAPDLYVLCAEEALQLGCLEISTSCLKMYFEGKPPANQFLCRAYLCQGQLKSPSPNGSVEDFEKAVLYFLKAIEISKKTPRYHFMVFNASVLYLQTVRPLLQPGRCFQLLSSLRQVVQSLDEVSEQDHSWRAELMMQVRHNLSESDLPEMTRQCSSLAVIYKIQTFKNRLAERNEVERKKEDCTKLEEIFHLLVDSINRSATLKTSSPLQNPTPIPPADRVAFLLELALLALQVKHLEVAANCLKELKSAGEASICQRIIMECVKCELNLLKKQAKMNEYSKPSVEARLKEIGKLDQLLQAAVREGDPQAMQAVCAAQWSVCLPLLQHNLRRHIKTPLLRVAQVLEDIQSSTLLEMLCQVHSELSGIEEEEGRLEASLTHLQKAMLLDKGTQQERLSSAFHLLQLRGTLYQTPTRAEDKAAMLMQQARDTQPQDTTDSRSILIAVGLLLAPDAFQMVLDADNTSKCSCGSEAVTKLSAKAQNHSASVQKVDGYMTRQEDDTNRIERVKLWASLVKMARKYTVWDVCRAACRFCLLYDDGRWKISKADKCRSLEEENQTEDLHDCNITQSCVKDLLHLLADICFISAEATIKKLQTEGMQLNSAVVPPAESGICEEDPHWVVYRDWIQALSAYSTSNFLRAAELGAEIREPWVVVTSNFLRAAELGAEIREPWVVVNTATYLWNYNTHLLAAGEHQRLLPTFQRLVEMLQNSENTGDRSLLVLLCDAVARGLIQPLCGADSSEAAMSEDSGKNTAGKGMERTGNVQGISIDPAALQDVHKALELCNYALHISNGNIPVESVSIAVRKQIVATWVQIKRLLQEQTGTNMDTDDKCTNEEVLGMTHVLVGVEMLLWNRKPGQMKFSVPSLSTLVHMASECSWTDAVVELQVWSQLAVFCHDAKDHNLVLYCTKRALQLENTAAQRLNTMPCVLYGPSSVNEMLSSAACLRGLSLVHESCGDPDSYREAMKVLLSSVRYAEKAENSVLCIAAAQHYWNTCLPLTQTPEQRRQLQEPLEKILHALVHTNTKHVNKQGKVKGLLALATLPSGSSKSKVSKEDDLTLTASIYNLLLYIHGDTADWKSALQLLDKAIRDMPPTRHRLPLFKHRILVKARLGENVLMDMQRFQEEGELCCSRMWHQVALCAGNLNQQLTCYQNAITTLLSAESQWQKVDFLLEFGEWLYSHNFPRADAQHQIEWAVDILLQVDTEQTGAESQCEKKSMSSVKCKSLVGVQGSPFKQSLSDLREVRRLNGLVRAHTLLAVMADRTSPQHQLNLLRAYSFVLQIWKVSMLAAHEISEEITRKLLSQPPSSAASRKGKDKGKSKKADPAEENPKRQLVDQALPTTLEEWACYSCPDQARQIFRSNSSPHCINTASITNQALSLFYLNLLVKEFHSLSLDHLTLPIMHLAETIAHDLMGRRSISDLYQLRILRTCGQLGMETHSPYLKKLQILSRIQEQEQIGCRKAIALERRDHHTDFSQKAEVTGKAASGQHNTEVCAQDIWLDKAEVCLSMGLYQPASQLLAEVHLVATELGYQATLAKSLLSLAVLACEEQNHAQALSLLDKAQSLGGDQEFWYHLTVTMVRAIAGQRDQDAQTKIAQIIKQGCGTLQLLLDQHVNQVPELTYLITSLQMRGAVECVHATRDGESDENICTEAAQSLKMACDTLTECAIGFNKLNYPVQAAEAHVECAHGLRSLANHSNDTEEKHRHLLDAFSQMQLAVKLQEHVVQNVQSQLPPQEESCGVSLAPVRRLLHLRLFLVEVCLDLLEQLCAEEKQQAVARCRKSAAEIALEEFTCCSSDLNSTEQEYMSVGRTLGQVVLNQLAAVSFHSLHDVKTRAHSLALTGKYLRLQAVQKDPIYVSTLWERHKKEEVWSDSKAFPMQKEDLGREKDRDSHRKELKMTSAKSAELQQRRHGAQQLLAQSSKTLSQAITLCLQHKLPSALLADASLSMLECCGQSDPAVAGQYLGLFQSCCSAAMMAEILSSACADSSVSQFSALLSLHRKLLFSQEERPSSILKGVEDSLNSLSKAFSHLTISPNHLNILTELPPNLKILLLQHTQDGSELYGAFYETTKVKENHKGKAMNVTGTLMCSSVAKVSVCPQALLALQEQTRAFGQGMRHALLKEACWHSSEDKLEAPQEPQVFPLKSTAEEKLSSDFRDIVQNLEDYLHPLLSQFDFSCFRLQDASVSLPETTTPKGKEKGGSAKANSPKEPEEYVVLLADRKLLELPLEALFILQGEALCSVSRDFSLQVLHRRLHRQEAKKVESDSKKETKGGKAAKGRGDQSKAIKVIPVNRILPPNTFPIDTHNFKYIVDPYNEGIFEGTSLTKKMTNILETHSQQFTPLWEGFMGSKQTPSLSEMEQLLSGCSAFIYLGMEHFTANIPPAKLPTFNLSGTVNL